MNGLLRGLIASVLILPGCLPAGAGRLPLGRGPDIPMAALPVARAPVTLASYGQIPMTFQANHGQMDERVAFATHRGKMQSSFTDAGVTHLLHGRITEDRVANEAAEVAWAVGQREAGLPPARPDPRRVGTGDEAPSESRSSRWAVRSHFREAAPASRPEARDRQEGIVSYFRGSPEEWITGVPTYGQVVYREAWPGIDAVYTAEGRDLKYAFVVAPGADPSRIGLVYEGLTGARLTENGQVVLET
ncbi:MAG: hypothetical protein ACKVVP_18215, partial [Chloroflexota bacterium]